ETATLQRQSTIAYRQSASSVVWSAVGFACGGGVAVASVDAGDSGTAGAPFSLGNHGSFSVTAAGGSTAGCGSGSATGSGTGATTGSGTSSTVGTSGATTSGSDCVTATTGSITRSATGGGGSPPTTRTTTSVQSSFTMSFALRSRSIS